MAYNVLKGNVQFINSDSGSIESIVDDHSNQTIAGIKTFSSPITASAFSIRAAVAHPLFLLLSIRFLVLVKIELQSLVALIISQRAQDLFTMVQPCQ